MNCDIWFHSQKLDLQPPIRSLIQMSCFMPETVCSIECPHCGGWNVVSVFPECHQKIYLHLLARGFKASTTKLIVGLSESPLVLLPLLEITTIQSSPFLWTLRVMLPVMLALTEPERGLDCGDTRNVNYLSQFVKLFFQFS